MSEPTELLPTFGFTMMLRVATIAMDRYRQEHPRWWKRKIDGTPIDNDLPVIMAEEFRDYVRSNRWHAFSDEELTCFGVIITNSGHSLLCEISEELARRKGEA